MLESTFIKDVLARAKQHYKTIVLPEGEDLRVLKAAHIINKDKICKFSATKPKLKPTLQKTAGT